MRIKKIELYNFGSYEGVNTFDIESTASDKRIVIVGGKNGAGKTTLFTAIQICLYGHIAFGYKASGKLYFKELFSLINDKARMDENEASYVRVVFVENRIDSDEFVMTRKWNWSNTNIAEEVSVEKNGEYLLEDDLIDFQSYLLHLIPPDLLNLYFFDGEKIAEFFLGEQRNNLKDALLTLSGNDTYEILYNSIRRILNGSESGNESVAQNYADQKEVLSEQIKRQQDLYSKIADIDGEIESLETAIKKETESYSASGGISLKEWKLLQEKIKNEEELREKLNAERKLAATEILPFLIVVDTLKKVREQANIENELSKCSTIQESISSPDFSALLSKLICDKLNIDNFENINDVITGIKAYFSNPSLAGEKVLFDLSGDEEVVLLNTISNVLKYDPSKFSNYQKLINKSLNRSKTMREELKKSSIENFEEHVSTISKMNYDLEKNHDARENLCSELATVQEQIESVNRALEITRKALEAELKQQSVTALSDRMILLVEELQELQYKNLIASVEKDLNKKFKELIRKDDFVSYIHLDLDFNLHLIRYQNVDFEKIKETVRKHGSRALKNSLKEFAYNSLIEKLNSTEERLAFDIAEYTYEFIELPIELDYTRFSNGEKQILVMSLYWAIMNQSNNELPFIIDTPFARIDTEHRSNITEKFFKELKGQLFVLSTNEELRHEHLAALDEQIAKVYLLEYGNDKKTHITQGDYFEV